MAIMLENGVRFSLLGYLLASTPTVGQRPGEGGRTEKVPATQQSVVVHVAAAQVIEPGLLIKTCGETQPVNPVHVAVEASKNGESKRNIACVFLRKRTASG